MKNLIIDGQVAGAAGDMFLSALLDLSFQEEKNQKEADKRREILVNDIASKIIKSAKLEKEAEIKITLERKNVRALEGIYLQIDVKEPHRHLHMPQAIEIIEESIKTLELSDTARQFSRRAIEILFEAEAKAHGESLEKVHLHEAGSLDTFLDIIGSAYLIEKLSLFGTKLSILPLNLGSGTVTFSHGTLPVPAPAIVEILKKYEIPSFLDNIKGEMFTPTAAIIIAALMELTKDITKNKTPPITIENIGIGFGTKQLEKSPNALRLIIGSSLKQSFPEEEITIIETNIDDCSGEIIGFLSQRLLDMGAKDVYLTPIYMKKGRPGTKISVLCLPKDENRFAEEIMTQTSTIGIRMFRSNKIMLSREIQEFEVEINDKKWKIRGKIAYGKDDEIIHFKPEFEDIKDIAEKTGLSILEINTLTNEKMIKVLKKREC